MQYRIQPKKTVSNRQSSTTIVRASTKSVSRRDGLSLLSGVFLLNQFKGSAKAASVESNLPPPAKICDGPDCLGEVNETLNACALNKPSCVSTLNDDEAHFMAPWEFEMDRDEAIERLVSVSTGGAYAPQMIETPFGVSQTDAAAYIAKGVLAVVQNGEMPERPQRRLKKEIVPFNGHLEERSTTAGGSEYLRFTFYPQDGPRDPMDLAEVIDAEFLFLKGDSIVNVRAVSRQQPETDGFGKGELGLSFTQGLVVDKNIARRHMDKLRKALQWTIAPVLTDFDPKFNAEVPLAVERIFQPFSERNNFRPSGESYPVE